MTLTTHAATGILVAYWLNDPLLGFAAAVVSHYILDMIPHGDEYLYWRLVHNLHDPLGRRIAIGDITAMIIVITATLLFKENPNNALILWGSLGAILPDLLMTLQTHLLYGEFAKVSSTRQRIAESILRILDPLQRLHKWAHDLIRTPIRLQEGYILQAIFLMGYALWFI